MDTSISRFSSSIQQLNVDSTNSQDFSSLSAEVCGWMQTFLRNLHDFLIRAIYGHMEVSSVGVPPVIIQFHGIFHGIFHDISILGYPDYGSMETPIFWGSPSPASRHIQQRELRPTRRTEAILALQLLAGEAFQVLPNGRKFMMKQMEKKWRNVEKYIETSQISPKTCHPLTTLQRVFDKTARRMLDKTLVCKTKLLVCQANLWYVRQNYGGSDKTCGVLDKTYDVFNTKFQDMSSMFNGS